MADNSYLRHLHPHQRGATPSAGSSSTAAAAAKEPLFGFMPRKVTAAQVAKAMVRGETIEQSLNLVLKNYIEQEHDTNPFTKQPHSAQYRKILESRKKLPVFAQMDEFYKMVS